jgi:replicative DNA helicase
MLTNIAAERAVLAALCQYASEAHTDCIDLLRPEIFTDTKNSLIYLTLSSLLKNNRAEIDIASIYSEATSLNYNTMICEKQEDKDYLKALFNFSISSSNVRDQVALLYKLYVARTLQDSAKRTFKELDEINGTEGLDSIISIPEKNLTSTINKLSYEDDLEIIGNSVDELLEYVESNPGGNLGVPTPFPIFNEVVGGGLRPGVHLICGRLKVGKSTVGKEVALHTAMNGIPTLFIDTEMSYDEQLFRMLAKLSGVSIRDIEKAKYKFNPADNKKVRIAAEQIKVLPLIHKNVSGKDFTDITSIIKRWIHKTVGIDASGKTNPHLVVYDYFKMMNPDVLKSMKEYEAMGYQIAAMHDLCKMYSTPVLSFAQINRDGISKDDTSVISQSDRLGWNCISLSLFKRKTADEIGEDGHKNGNIKLIPLEGRFMSRLDDGDYINMYLDGNISSLKEINTKYGSNQKEFKVQDDE